MNANPPIVTNLLLPLLPAADDDTEVFIACADLRGLGENCAGSLGRAENRKLTDRCK